MHYNLVIEERFTEEVFNFIDYLYQTGYDKEKLESIFLDIDWEIKNRIQKSPEQNRFFYLTGEPYRAKLYRFSRKQQFWIVYKIEEGRDEVKLLAFWHCSLDPSDLNL